MSRYAASRCWHSAPMSLRGPDHRRHRQSRRSHRVETGTSRWSPETRCCHRFRVNFARWSTVFDRLQAPCLGDPANAGSSSPTGGSFRRIGASTRSRRRDPCGCGCATTAIRAPKHCKDVRRPLSALAGRSRRGHDTATVAAAPVGFAYGHNWSWDRANDPWSTELRDRPGRTGSTKNSELVRPRTPRRDPGGERHRNRSTTAELLTRSSQVIEGLAADHAHRATHRHRAPSRPDHQHLADPS